MRRHKLKDYPRNGLKACQKCGFVCYEDTGGYCAVDGPTESTLKVLRVLEEFENPKEPDCCDQIDLDRLGTGANEVASWGVYKCKSCKQTWYCLAGFNEPWQKDLKLVGE
jgi:hypothetical protein